MSPVVFSEDSARLELIPDFVENDLFEHLLANVPWQQNHIRIFGKTIAEPRLTAWFGPPYSYSGLQWPETPMPEILRQLSSEITALAGFSFNSCLLNYYRNGQDSMGWHRDNEPEMDQRCIASISVGDSRDFLYRKGTSGPSQALTLTGGSLLLMFDFQKDFYHAIPKRKNIDNGRINLTFRHIKTLSHVSE